MYKKTVFLVWLLVLALVSVFPVASSVNNSAGSKAIAVPAPALIADGSPSPVPVPHRQDTLVADGSPSPVPVPHRRGALIADGFTTAAA
jgi:hypothetical protein